MNMERQDVSRPLETIAGTVGRRACVKTKVPVIRRCLVVLVSVILLGGTLAESASAGTLTVRRDGQEQTFGRDIRTVVTGTIGNRVVLRIGTWDPYIRSGDFEVVSMDTHGRRAADRTVFFTNGGPDRGFQCKVTRSGGRGVIGRRNARRPNERSIACNLPRSWFDIHKVVRFRVRVVSQRDRGWSTEQWLLRGPLADRRRTVERGHLLGADIARLLRVQPDLS